MRMTQPLECYIDSFHNVNICMSRNFYGGQSRLFHLKDEKGHLVPLTIDQKREAGSYNVYECSVETPLGMNHKYTLFDEHCQSVPAIYSHIVKTKEFSDAYAVPEEQLGCFYTPEKTTFRIWSPTASSASLILHEKDGQKTIGMHLKDKGVWEATVEGDLLQTPYEYEVEVNSRTRRTPDPWNFFTGLNTQTSSVDTFDALNMPEKTPVEPIGSYADAVIYEASIRDMTSQADTGVTHPKTFAGFVEENEETKKKQTGFSWIKSLGVTHVQLMPVMDFGSVDEEYPNIYYNWGYDPNHHRALEGSYALNPADPRSRIEEFAHLVQELHKAGLKVSLDMVLNHAWNKDNYPLDKLVPDYYFLVDKNGNYSNGSFCGNDIDTRPEMSKKYLLDSCRQLIEKFDIDAFRFDLMGILDVDFMNELTEMARSIKPDFMVYGEGWNMPSYVPEDLRASQNNQHKMPNVAHFSDRFREVVRGSNGELTSPGFALGNTGEISAAGNVMRGSVPEHRYDSPLKALNYVECHDNHTLWDKISAACAYESEEDRKKRQVIATAMVLLAQGIPFMHAGQEFARTKYGLDNTYNRSDYYNKIDYTRRDANLEMTKMVKDLIDLRRHHSSLRLKDSRQVMNQTAIETIEQQVLVYRTWDEHENLISFINPTHKSFEYILDREGKVLFDSSKTNPDYTWRVNIPPLSVIVVSL